MLLSFLGICHKCLYGEGGSRTFLTARLFGRFSYDFYQAYAGEKEMEDYIRGKYGMLPKYICVEGRYLERLTFVRVDRLGNYLRWATQ